MRGVGTQRGRSRFSLERLPDEGPDGLVARAKAGDHAAAVVLYDRYASSVRQYLRRMLGHDHDAEDVAQSVFTSVFDRLGSYRDDGAPFEHWLFAVVRNAGRRHRARAARTDVTDPAALDAARDFDHHRTGFQGDSAALAFDALTSTLTRQQRRALLLLYGFGLSSREAASLLGETPAAVRATHTRSLAKLATRRSRLGL